MVALERLKEKKMNQLKDRFTMLTPEFKESDPYSKFIQRFKIYMMRDEDCNLVLNGTTPEDQIIRNENESESKYNTRVRLNETLKTSWNRGKAKIYSSLFFACADTNSRATNILLTNTTKDGIEELRLLDAEYADEAVIKEDAQNLKLLDDNRRIQAGETVTHFLDDITKLRLRLRHLNIELSDDDIVNKLIHGMSSPQNKNYKSVQLNFVSNSKNLNLTDLTTSLRKVDSIMLLDDSPQESSQLSTDPLPISEAVNYSSSHIPEIKKPNFGRNVRRIFKK